MDRDEIVERIKAKQNEINKLEMELYKLDENTKMQNREYLNNYVMINNSNLCGYVTAIEEDKYIIDEFLFTVDGLDIMTEQEELVSETKLRIVKKEDIQDLFQYIEQRFFKVLNRQ